MSENLASELLKITQQHPKLCIVFDNQAIDETQLSTMLCGLDNANIALKLADIYQPIERLLARANHELDKQNFNLPIEQLMAYVILRKLEILTPDLEHTQAMQAIKPRLNDLLDAFHFQLQERNTKSKTGRRRASLHRANLQLAKNRNQQKHNSEPPVAIVNLLQQFNLDSQLWDDEFIHQLITKTTSCFSVDTLANPEQLQKQLTPIVAKHHKYQLLLNNHLARIGAWLFKHIELKHFTINEHTIESGTLNECERWITSQYQTFCKQLTQADEEFANIESYLSISSQISRQRLILLLDQGAQLPCYRVYLHQSAQLLFEPYSSFADTLDQLLACSSDIIKMYWHDCTQNSEQLASLDQAHFCQQTQQWFYQTQAFETQLLTFAASIDKLATRVGHNSHDCLAVLFNLNQSIESIVQYKAEVCALHCGEINTIEPVDGQYQTLQTINTKLAQPLINLLELFDATINGYFYHQQQTIENPMLRDIHQSSAFTINNLVKTMDQAYNNWLNLLQVLRPNSVVHD